MAHRGCRRSRREPGVPLLHSAAERRLALLLGFARRVRRRRAQDRHRPELRRFRLRDACRVPHRRAGLRHRRVCGGHRAGLPAVEPARGLEPPLHDRPRDPRRDDREGLEGRGLRTRSRGDVRAVRRQRRGGQGDRRLALRGELLEPHRHALHRRRGRAIRGNQPARPQPPDRRLAAGSLEQRRRPRQRHRRVVRRRPHVVAQRRPVHGVRGRQCGQRRRLGSRERPVGDLRSRRHRPPGRAGADRDELRCRIAERHRGEPLDRRGAHVEQSAER